MLRRCLTRPTVRREFHSAATPLSTAPFGRNRSPPVNVDIYRQKRVVLIGWRRLFAGRAFEDLAGLHFSSGTILINGGSLLEQGFGTHRGRFVESGSSIAQRTVASGQLIDTQNATLTGAGTP